MVSSGTREELIRALRQRQIEVKAETEKLREEGSDYQKRLLEISDKLHRLQSEQDELDALCKRYGEPTSEAIDPAIPAVSRRLSVSQAVLDTVLTAGGSIEYELLLMHVADLRRQGLLDTASTSDDRKLIASTIGNLARAGKLSRQNGTVYAGAMGD